MNLRIITRIQKGALVCCGSNSCFIFSLVYVQELQR